MEETERTSTDASPVLASESAAGAPSGRVRANAPWIGSLVVTLLLGAYALGVRLYVVSMRDSRTIRGLRVAHQDLGEVPFDQLEPRLAAATGPSLDERITLGIGEDRVLATRREAGFVVDVPAMAAMAREVGRTGNLLRDLRDRRRGRTIGIDLAVPYRIDRARAIDFLTDLKELVDRAPVDAHLDLEHHTVAVEREGHLLSVFEALTPLEEAARSGAPKADLPSVAVAPRIKQSDLAGIDISTVLATWETHYSTSAIDSDRTYNLKVGASKLDGHVLKPHELFSFNGVVGDRTEKEGYRVAPVISGGELVDGLAGGMCQIASTLHAASFFAGFDIVSSTPHSRPSAYIPLGLDSTVVWPSTDLKIRNPFDFPVVMHFTVNQGSVKVELLGQKKVYQALFEREIVEEHVFGTQTRHDREAPAGQQYVTQEGYPGYRAIRRRFLWPADAELPKSLGPHASSVQKLVAAKRVPEPVKVDKWTVAYPATEQINVVGSGPQSLKKKEAPPRHHIPPVPSDDKPFGRILR